MLHLVRRLNIIVLPFNTSFAFDTVNYDVRPSLIELGFPFLPNVECLFVFYLHGDCVVFAT